MLDRAAPAFAAALSPPGPDGEVVISDGLTGSDWIQAGAISVGAIIIAIAAGRIVRGVMRRAVGNGFAAIITGRAVAYTIVVVGLIYALSTLGVRVGPLIGALGLTGIVLALALQSVAENFVGALILQARRPFTVGDTVELHDHVGVVTDIDSRTTVLRSLDGTMIRIPNRDVLTLPIVNLTREPMRRSELVVGLAYDTDLGRATEVLMEAIGRVPRISTTPPPAVMLTEFGASTIDVTVYYWHRSDVPSALATRHDLVIAVHHALADAGITIAFPQTVVWPGHDAADNPYGRAPDPDVVTERPNAPLPFETPTDEPASRLPWRR